MPNHFRLIRPLAWAALAMASLPASAQQPQSFSSGATLHAVDLNTAFAGTLWRGNNLSDVASASTARVNLGLGTMATQNAAAAAITGGTATGLTQASLSTSGNAAALGTSSFPLRILVGPITGTFPANSAPQINSISCYADTADGTSVGDLPACLGVNYTFGGSGAQQARIAGQFGTLLTGAGIGTGGNAFLTATESRATADAPMGSTNPASPRGQVVTASTYAIATGKAGAVGNVWTEEANWQVKYGAFSSASAGKGFIRLGDDWGTVGYGDRLSGRYGLSIGSQQPNCDFTSSASALASCGQSLPPFDIVFPVGTSHGEWIGTSATTLLTPIWQTVANTNSCSDCGAGSTGSPPHGGSAIAAAIIKPMILGNGVDLHNVQITGNSFFSNGFQVKGTGEVDIGTAKFVPTNTTTGLTIDVTGKYVSGISVGAFLIQKKIGETVFDRYGGIYQVSGLDGSGNVNALTIVQPAYVQGAAPCTTNCSVDGSGPPMLVNYTWSTPTGLNLNPTGADVTLPAGVRLSTANGFQATGFNIVLSGADVVAGSTGHGLYTTDTAGHHPFIGGQGDTTQMLGADNTGALSTVWSYANNSATTQPFRVLKPLQPESYLAPAGAAPGTPSTCGTSPTMAASSTDISGVINVGSGSATACTLNLATTHSRAPFCTATLNVAAAPALITQTNGTSTTVVFTSAANMASGQIYYHCM
jgi:hypothetical protein